MNYKLQQQKNSTALRLEKMVQLPVKDSFSEKNTRTKIGKFKNLRAAMSRHYAQEGRTMALVTLTFGTKYRINFKNMSEQKIKSIAQSQYNSLMAFVDKLRKNKRLNYDRRYFAVIELQSDGSLHLHISISVMEEDLFSLIEFVHDFKSRHRTPYTHNKIFVLPIGRSHIGLSSIHLQKIKNKYKLIEKNSSGRSQHYMPELESRKFTDGDWTALEFYTKSMIEDRYEEMIFKYLEKTIDGSFCLESEDIKEGVSKCQLDHDTKTICNDNYIEQLQVAFIRQVCGRVYTHSRLPFPFSLYQRHRKALVAYRTDYKVYYKCIEDLENGELKIFKNNVYTSDGSLITDNKNKFRY